MARQSHSDDQHRQDADEEQIEKIRKLQADGVDTAAIAQRFGYSYNGMWRLLKRAKEEED